MKTKNPNVLFDTFHMPFLCEKAKTFGPVVYALFREMAGTYDSDIDPFHNPDWVSGARRKEEQVLQIAIDTARICNDEFYENKE